MVGTAMDMVNPNTWSTSFDAFFGQFDAFFQRSETRENAQRYMRGLLADVKRKNSWQLAEAVGLLDPHPLQRVLNEALWSADEVRRGLRQVTVRQLGYTPGIGVIDESGFVKWGEKSAGVARQYCGRLGKVENCQVGVYLGYVAPTGAAFLDCQLYLHQDWCADRERCQAARIPDEVEFQTKPQLAQAMLEGVWDEGIPMQWVTADTLYGNSPGLRYAIHQAGRSYVMAIGCHHRVLQGHDQEPIGLKALIQRLPEAVWERLYFRVGERGVIGHEWARLPVSMPNDEVGEQWLVIQRTLGERPQYTFWLSNASSDTPLADLAAVALSRHLIEELLEEAKGDVGMADYEVRHWHGWYRHMTLVMMAHTWLKLLQHDEREKKSAAHLVELQSA